MMVYFAWLVLIARQQMAFASEQMKSRLLSGGYFLLAWVILLWVVITVFQVRHHFRNLEFTAHGVTLPFKVVAPVIYGSMYYAQFGAVSAKADVGRHKP